MLRLRNYLNGCVRFRRSVSSDSPAPRPWSSGPKHGDRVIHVPPHYAPARQHAQCRVGTLPNFSRCPRRGQIANIEYSVGCCRKVPRGGQPFRFHCPRHHRDQRVCWWQPLEVSAARIGNHQPLGNRNTVLKVNVVGRSGVGKRATAVSTVRGTPFTSNFPGMTASRCPRGGQLAANPCRAPNIHKV